MKSGWGGHSFESVAKLKENRDKHVGNLIYRCNDGRLNDKPNNVFFKSSRLEAKIANNMKRESPLLCLISMRISNVKQIDAKALQPYA